MLKSLSVSNYILIDSLETSFPEGLIIISGETGAGKSILLGALSLALGAKADSSMVGPAGDNCVVEAVFGITPQVKQFLLNNDLPCEGDETIIRRIVSKSGRSRSFIDDEPVSASILQELSSHLVDIHSQHQTLRLQDAGFRLEALDLYAGAFPMREECRSAWTAMTQAREALEKIRAQKARALMEEDYNRAVYEKLSDAKLREGELQELEQEQKQLAHAEELRELLSQASGLLETDEISVSGRIRESSKLLDKASRFIDSLEGLAARLESLRLELEDIESEMERTAGSIDVSPSRLEAVDQRLSLIYSLFSRHSVSSEKELLDEMKRLESLVEDTEGLQEKEKELEKKLEKASAEYEKCASALHKMREGACDSFGNEILTQLRGLDLDRASFTVSMEESKPGPLGKDSVRFLFASGGIREADIAKAASGGELSRIMLSLKNTMARFTKMPTLVFDEIDTGVSGSTADKMGSMVCSMGEKMQVFAITHLPQVAAKGNAHFLVSKKDNVTSISRLDSASREREIARMLSGAVVTNEALANARSLLNN